MIGDDECRADWLSMPAEKKIGYVLIDLVIWPLIMWDVLTGKQ
jgi:hypothetical protein